MISDISNSIDKINIQKGINEYSNTDIKHVVGYDIGAFGKRKRKNAYGMMVYEDENMNENMNENTSMQGNSMQDMNANTSMPSQDEQTYTDQIFGHNSVLNTIITNQNISNINTQLEILSKTFTSPETIYTNDKGQPILNANPSNIWFSQHVALIFSMGAIYDEDDEIKMNTIRNYFNDESEAYLLNHVRIEDYQSSQFIKYLEAELRIGNGNYHVFLVPIVYCDESDLINAPEKIYQHTGIIAKYMSWDAIYDYMTTIMTRYGLITKINRKSDVKSNDIGSEGLPERIGEEMINTKFNYNSECNDDQIMSTIESNLLSKTDINDEFNKRIRQTKLDRQGEYNHLRQNNSKRKTLYTQMYEDKQNKLVGDVIPDPTLGVELRFNERKMPELKKVNEYQLFNDNSTFDRTCNKNEMTKANETRQSMPRFMLHASRGTSNGSRHVNMNVDGISAKTFYHS